MCSFRSVVANIKDVAKLAGVSPATVSRVLSNKGNTSEDVRARVQMAIRKTNYVRPGGAKPLVGGSRTICLTIARNSTDIFGNPFFDSVLYGVSSTVEQHGMDLQLAVFHSVDRQIEKCVQLYKQQKIDGLILTGILSVDKDRLLRTFHEEHIPFVMIGRTFRHDVFSVHNDNLRDGFMAARHLIDAGYRKLVVLTQDTKLDVFAARISGYRQAVQQVGLDAGPERIVQAGPEEEDIMDALQRLLDEGIAVDSVITMDSVMSLSVLKFCQLTGLRVPQEVGIIGFNDAPYLVKVSPTLSCVEMNGANLGAEAFHLLNEIMNEPQAMSLKKNVTLPSKLMIRQSTARSAFEGT